jgi:hypothetical protein
MCGTLIGSYSSIYISSSASLICYPTLHVSWQTIPDLKPVLNEIDTLIRSAVVNDDVSRKADEQTFEFRA